MDTKHILEQVRDGAVSVEEAEVLFRLLHTRPGRAGAGRLPRRDL